VQIIPLKHEMSTVLSTEKVQKSNIIIGTM
jgi:hypothetical protein